MRNSFIKSIIDIGKDHNVILLINDTGQFVLREFSNNYPDRLINCGIAEQNMIGVAAGLAAMGKTVFVYSIASFFARCYEQIKVDICYHNMNVKFIGVGIGLSYGTMGITHHATEYIGMFRSLPNMMIVSPSDSIETSLVTEKIYNHYGPVYVGLGLNAEKNYHDDNYKYYLGKLDIIRSGKDISLIATGRMVENAMWASYILEKYNISAQVINVHTIKPLDKEGLDMHIRPVVLSIEEHNINGGLGSAIAEYIAEDNQDIIFKRLGIIDRFCHEYGSRSYLEDRLKLSDLWIANEAISLIKGGKSDESRIGPSHN